MRYSLTLLAVCLLAFSSACSKAPTLTAPGTVGSSALRSNSVARTPVATAAATRNSGKTTVAVESTPEQGSDYSNEDVSSEISRQGSTDQNDSWE
jgi:hypothetical protein